MASGVKLDHATVLSEFGAQVRRGTEPDGSGARSHSQLRSSLTAQLSASPQSTAMVVAMAGDEPVCSARIDFYAGTQFAGLFGGGTLPQWRGRGIYRALVAHRAQLAAARGYRYLQVDASPESRPILGRLGFARLALTTPYTWSPG